MHVPRSHFRVPRSHMLRPGIVGLPIVGKSTLFNALTSPKAPAAEHYPFCTVEPNAGRVARGVAALDAGRGAREAGESEDAVICLRQPGLPTAKRILHAANVDAGDLAAGGGKWLDQLRAAVQAHHEEAEIVLFSAKFEAELGELSGDERTEYLASAGVSEPGLDRLIHAGYRLLGLQTFFTVGENEVRAWTMRRGETAFHAAGAIHSDFQRGFIRAETAALEEFVKAGSYKVARELGLVRSEGRDYLVKDGDILLFRFNV